ncbi:MAG: T9SS type A sorting domain-containing protein [Ignavibacteriales bacterium]|nr:T9SS type A sorting domain-containing protein [Ignavibacteriales bacterium]
MVQADTFFQKNGLNKTISNSTITSDSLIVALPPTEQPGYSSVTVLLDSVIHPDVTELIITLKHIGIIDTIIYELPGGEDLISCFLDDYALQNISSSAPPFSGIYKPYKPLTAFIGADLNGEWIIEIEDNFQWDDGTLKAWGLIFNKDNATDINVETGLDQVNSFILYQNYPNPFNPNTTISWQSPVRGWQTIKVFDVLGRELATIVDGYYGAGSHSTLYIANSTLPSGVYYYQLRAGNFVQTKKMVFKVS